MTGLSAYCLKQRSDETEQALQQLQGGTGSGGPAAVLRGAWRGEDVRAGRDVGGCRRAGAVGGVRGARMLQVHGSPLGDEGDAWLVQERRGGPLGDEGDACYQRDARTCSRWSMGATSTTTATPPAAATVGSSTAVRRWCRCSH